MISTQFIGVGMLLAFVLLICFGLAFSLHTKNEFHTPPTDKSPSDASRVGLAIMPTS